MNSKIIIPILLVLVIAIAIGGCLGGEEEVDSPVIVNIDSYDQEGSVDENGTAEIRYKLSLTEGNGTTYVALFVPSAFNVVGNIRDKNFERFGYVEIDEDIYEAYMVENDAFEYPNTPAQEYIAEIKVDTNQLATRDRRNTILRIYWKDGECTSTIESDLSCYTKLGESRKSILMGK